MFIQPLSLQYSKSGQVRGKFGEGLVIEAGGGFATVMFDSAGRKKLALDLAPLEKITDKP